MKARYTDFTGRHHFVLENNTRVTISARYDRLCGRWDGAGDFIRFSKEQVDLYVPFILSLGRPDAFEPCYVDIPEELLK